MIILKVTLRRKVSLNWLRQETFLMLKLKVAEPKGRSDGRSGSLNCDSFH
jgi:hypothetical protein